jgi:hypothetical protein
MHVTYAKATYEGVPEAVEAPANAAGGYARFFRPPVGVRELLLELAALSTGEGAFRFGLAGRSEELEAEGRSRMSSGRSFHSWPGPVVW